MGAAFWPNRLAGKAVSQWSFISYSVSLKLPWKEPCKPALSVSIGCNRALRGPCGHLLNASCKALSDTSCNRVISPADVKKGHNVRKDKGAHVIWDVQLVLGLADCGLAFQVAVIGASDNALHHSVNARDSHTVQSVITQAERKAVCHIGHDTRLRRDARRTHMHDAVCRWAHESDAKVEPGG